MSFQKPTSRPLEVVIVGGSLAGLMCGIALKHAGHNVRILEQDYDQRASHMAGVCLGRDGEEFLTRHDRMLTRFTQESNRVQVLRKNGEPMVFVSGRREITSWDTYYFRLRANFDAYHSSFYPEVPIPRPSDGTAVYQSRARVLDITRSHNNQRLVLKVLDLNAEKVVEREADLVIGADGPNSFVRSKYLPRCQRQYSGYIAWRGTVCENRVSERTRGMFNRNAIVSMYGRHHYIMYMIPGENGSLQPGERYLNFLWYTNETPAALDEIMIDGVDGHRHHNIVPAGRVRKDIWDERLRHAELVPLEAPFLEVLQKIENPFIQVVTDFCAPQAAFEDGKVLLMGDSLCLLRPHTAFSGTQAAFHTLRIEDYVEGRIGLYELEDKVLRFSRLHSSQTAWWGMFYQSHIAVALVWAMIYWFYCGLDQVKSWWAGEEPLLRTAVSRKKAMGPFALRASIQDSASHQA